jgi:c-di-GMP-binding flagellar brake protein YcgR
MPANHLELLTEAVARNCAAVLSLPSAGMLRHQKSRFLSEDEKGIWAEADAGEFALIEELIVSEIPAGISFKSGQSKIVFATPILEINRQYAVNAHTMTPAVRLAFPDDIKTIQRRHAYRVRNFEGSGLAARVWRMPPRGYLLDRAPAAAEIITRFRDLSMGGMGVTFLGKDGAAPKVTTDDRLRVEIRVGETTLLIEGRMRHPSGPQRPGSISTGIQFKDMSNDIEGRQKASQLTRMLGDMQREEVRRARLGVNVKE